MPRVGRARCIGNSKTRSRDHLVGLASRLRANRWLMLIIAVVTISCSSGSLTSMLEGKIVRTDQQPVAGRVDLYAWPTQEAVEALESGDEIPTVLLDEAEVDQDGAFELQTAPAKLIDLGNFAEDDGSITIQLDAFSDEGAITTVFYKVFLDFSVGRVERVTTADGEPLPNDLVVQVVKEP